MRFQCKTLTTALAGAVGTYQDSSTAIYVREAILYPQKTGNDHRTFSSGCECSSTIWKDRFLWLGSLCGNEKLKVTAGGRTINVKIYQEGRPASFAGAPVRPVFDFAVNLR
jgi:hypothetical protein